MKRLLAALLPSDSREHVMGDLAERGYGLRDFLSVLPSVWWNVILRLYTSPTLSFAGATEADLERRALEFLSASRRNNHLQLAVISLLSYPIMGTAVFLIPIALFLLFSRGRAFDPKRHVNLLYRDSPTWRDTYASILGRNRWGEGISSFAFLYANVTFLMWFSPESVGAGGFVLRQQIMFVLIALVTLPWMIKVRRERRGLELVTEPALRDHGVYPVRLSIVVPLYCAWLLTASLPLPVPRNPVFRSALALAVLCITFIPAALSIRSGLRALKIAREREAAAWKSVRQNEPTKLNGISLQ